MMPDLKQKIVKLLLGHDDVRMEKMFLTSHKTSHKKWSFGGFVKRRRCLREGSALSFLLCILHVSSDNGKHFTTFENPRRPHLTTGAGILCFNWENSLIRSE
jgi:hypothetical protein